MPKLQVQRDIVGPYRHLDNVWASAMQMARGEEFRQSKKHSPFDAYANSPDEVAESELRVAVHFRLKPRHCGMPVAPRELPLL